MRQHLFERLLRDGGYLLDNVAITAGLGTSIGTDTIGGVDYQRIKAGWGADGAYNDPSAAAPFPMEPGLKLTEQCTRASFTFSSAADNTIIAADAANKLRIYALMFTCDSPVSIKLGEGGPTYWTGPMKFGLGGGLLLTQQGEPHFMTSAINKAFLMNLSAAVVVSGTVWYTAVP